MVGIVERSGPIPQVESDREGGKEAEEADEDNFL
jgi:hypothetical protein